MSDKIPCPKCGTPRYVAYNAGQRDLAAALVCTACERTATEPAAVPKPRGRKLHPGGPPCNRIVLLVRAVGAWLRTPLDADAIAELAHRLASEREVTESNAAEWRARLTRVATGRPVTQEAA